MSKRTRYFLPILLLALPLSLQGEEIVTSDGQVYNTATMKRSGENILVKVTTASGGVIETGIPISRITKVSFIEPPELAKAKIASDLANADAVNSLTADFVSKQAEFGDLPGSWFLQMAQLRLLALASAGKDADAAALAGQIGMNKVAGADSLARGGTLFGPLNSGDTAAVIVGAKSIPRIGGDQGSALAQLALGRALLSKKDYASALRAFLTIKVFYPSATLLQPAALMGAANAYIGLKDGKRAVQALHEIWELYPASPQAAEAKKMAAGISNP